MKPIKSDIVATANIIHILFLKIWEEEHVPTHWKGVHLIKILKKGDLSKRKKYGDMTLLSAPGQIFGRALLNWVENSVKAQLPNP